MTRIPKNGWSKDRKYFNGKPIEHWERMAKELVVDALVRASFSMDSRSVPGEKAARQLMGMALGVDRVMVAEVIAIRDQCRRTFQGFLDMLLPDPPKKARNKKKR